MTDGGTGRIPATLDEFVVAQLELPVCGRCRLRHYWTRRPEAWLLHAYSRCPGCGSQRRAPVRMVPKARRG